MFRTSEVGSDPGAEDVRDGYWGCVRLLARRGSLECGLAREEAIQSRSAQPRGYDEAEEKWDKEEDERVGSLPAVAPRLPKASPLHRAWSLRACSDVTNSLAIMKQIPQGPGHQLRRNSPRQNRPHSS
ncbi:hypothetical protein DFP72DRAFT_853742 [Ephemerocybe angulata]|uniref:Uncharacterized protein n=1 Tax=Ephemerocybe angulata TaxID=980116 RepID=A0A8H6HM33_9AGAR|nr:hypothetical protein DFP72DRAFT_853742 [Tulosesus angulatus]